jgi:hypothetical protein
MSTQITLDLPDSLAKEAAQAGLLTTQAIEALLREAMRQRARDELRQAMDRMAAVDEPPMTEDERAGSVCLNSGS